MTFRSKARRAGWLLVVAAFAFGIVSAILPSDTKAYGLVSTRSIEMSSDEASGAGGLGGGTNVIYKVTFNTVTATQSIGAIVVKFCDNDPIMGDTCTAPAGMDINKATLSINNTSTTTAPAGLWTGLTLNTSSSTANMMVLTRSSQFSQTGAGTISFEMGNGTTNGVTNPNTTNHTFFARIFVFSSTTPTLDQAHENQTVANGGPTDAGGDALATANVLNVTAKVQEQLTFCVYNGANCAAGGTDYALGDTNGVLSSTTQPYLNANGNFLLASNALGGVVVRLKGDTLTSGAFTITPDGNACTADLSTSSSEQFGIRVVSYGAGQQHPSAGRYDCTAGNHMFDPTVTNTTYGDPFVVTPGATDQSSTNFELEAKASSTTEAGVYNTKLMLIATATY